MGGVTIFKITKDHAAISDNTKYNLVFQAFVRLKYNKNGTLANHAKKSTLYDMCVIEIHTIPMIKNQTGLMLFNDKLLFFIFYQLLFETKLK